MHYKLHAEIDKHHAAEFFQSAAGVWSGGGTGRAHIESGVELGLYLFNRLYVDLDRSRRGSLRMSTAPIPHLNSELLESRTRCLVAKWSSHRPVHSDLPDECHAVDSVLIAYRGLVQWALLAPLYLLSAASLHGSVFSHMRQSMGHWRRILC